MIDAQKQVDEALERGRFEGQVLTSLADIKTVLNQMDKKHTLQDEKIERKADKDEVEALKKRVWTMSGAAAALSTILSQIL